MVDNKQTVFFEDELLALIVAVTLWEPVIGGALIACCMGDNSARGCHFCGSKELLRLQFAGRVGRSWNVLARFLLVRACVPSLSNIDKP